MASRKRRKVSEIAELFSVIDKLAAESQRENEENRYTTAFGGDLHERLTKWRKEHPDQEDEYVRTYRDLKGWDESKHPRVSKSEGQGVLGFYDDNFHLAVDHTGTRVRFEIATAKDLDDWWDVQEEEEESRHAAHRVKRGIKNQIRNHLAGPTDTVGRVMREVFGWPEALLIQKEAHDEVLEAAD